MQISVVALPAPGHLYRRRAGRAWGAEPVVVEVVDSPVGPDQISPAQYAALRDDRHIKAIPVGDMESPAALDEKVARIKAEEKCAALERQLAGLHEEQDEFKAVSEKTIAALQAQIVELRKQVEAYEAKAAAKKLKG